MMMTALNRYMYLCIQMYNIWKNLLPLKGIFLKYCSFNNISYICILPAPALYILVHVWKWLTGYNAQPTEHKVYNQKLLYEQLCMYINQQMCYSCGLKIKANVRCIKINLNIAVSSTAR